MKVNIQSLSFHATEKLTDFTADKVNKLNQFTDRIIEAEVVLKVDKSETKENKFCEIRLAIPGNDLFASRQEATFEAAISKTVDALKQQLQSWKEKTQSRSNATRADQIEIDE